MINKNIIISIGILIILSVLFDRFLRKTQLSSVLNEHFEVNNTNVDPGPKYSPSGESYVDYSVDFNNFKLRLANGYFKIKNVGDAFLSYIGLLTIVITKDDYRDSPFDTQDNILNSFRKWQYFKYDNKFYKIVIPETEPEPEPEYISYGDELHIKNLYGSGTYLDTCGGSSFTACQHSGSYAVSTTTSKTRDGTSGTWVIESADGLTGAVSYGDELHIKNLYSSGTYLDTCGDSSFTACQNSGRYAVSTTTSKTRDGTSGTWVIESADGLTGAVSYGDELHIKNVYRGGTYLDTCGGSSYTACQHIGSYAVSTTTSKTRDGTSGTWQIISDNKNTETNTPETNTPEYIKEDGNGTITIEIQFESVVDDDPVSFKDELILSELSFYIGPYENAKEFTEERATDYATDLLSKLGEINNGVACGWHYNEETGGAAGYFSEILNDTEWQNKNQELYTSLSNFICPSYMPVCTGQRRTGIVPGKCITLKDNCNNGIVDNMMGIERPPWDTTKIVDKEGIIYANIIKKNIANHKALKSTIDKLSYVVDEPSIETFQNAEDETCKFHIENKCYDQYVEVDKNYYDTGAEIFNNVFPTTDQDIFKKTCYTITHWISKNIVYLLSYKFIVGGLAALLYWSMNPHLDFQIRVFKSFIAFVFCEIYLLYNVYKHIIKPTVTQRTPVLA